MKKYLKNLFLGLAQSDSNYGLTRYKTNSNFEKSVFYGINNGIINLDTAPNYLGSEKIIRKIHSRSISISSKLSLIECSLGELKFRVINQLESIFNKNKINKIENFFLHDPLIPLDQKRWKIIYKILNNYKKRKKINKIGVSVYTKEEVINILKIFTPDIIQFPYNIFNQTFDDNFLKLLKKKKIKLQARSIFMQGALIKNVKNNYFKIWKKNFELWDKYNYHNPKNKLRNCLSLIFNNKYIDSVVIGVENIDQLKQIIKLFKSKKISSKTNNLSKFKTNDEYLIDPRLWKKN